MAICPPGAPCSNGRGVPVESACSFDHRPGWALVLGFAFISCRPWMRTSVCLHSICKTKKCAPVKENPMAASVLTIYRRGDQPDLDNFVDSLCGIVVNIAVFRTGLRGMLAKAFNITNHRELSFLNRHTRDELEYNVRCFAYDGQVQCLLHRTCEDRTTRAVLSALRQMQAYINDYIQFNSKYVCPRVSAGLLCKRRGCYYNHDPNTLEQPSPSIEQLALRDKYARLCLSSHQLSLGNGEGLNWGKYGVVHKRSSGQPGAGPLGDVYVWELVDGHFYTGFVLTVAEERGLQHIFGMGAKWTRLYTPLRLTLVFRRVPKLRERIETLRHMAQHGISNVRGDKWVAVKGFPQHRIEEIEFLLANLAARGELRASASDLAEGRRNAEKAQAYLDARLRTLQAVKERFSALNAPDAVVSS